MPEDEISKHVSQFAKKSQKNRLTETQLEYWINKCDSDVEKARQKLKERQTTFSKEKLIKRYGEEKGLRRWVKRQEKWQKSYKHSNFSKISQELFNELYKKIKCSYNEIYFAQLNKNKEIDESGKNNEYTLLLNDKIIKPDFFIKDINKIIEFDDIYWHRKNPENKTREAKRDLSIISSGYSILHINEYNYRKNPEKEIQKCIEFING